MLPLHGGPPLTEERTRVVQERVHQILQLIIDRGRVDGTITADVTPYDIVAFGALLAQPQHTGPEWDATCHRLLATYVAGLSAGAAAAR